MNEETTAVAPNPEAVAAAPITALGAYRGRSAGMRDKLNGVIAGAGGMDKVTALNTAVLEAAAKKLHDKQAKPSPLVNALVNKVVKEQNKPKALMHWDDISDLCTLCRSSLYDMSSIRTFLPNKELMACIHDLPRFQEVVGVFSNDLKVVATALKDLSEKHEGKNTAITDDLEMFEAVDIYTKYLSLLDATTTTLMPVWDEAMEHLTLAEQALLAKTITPEEIEAAKAAALTAQPPAALNEAQFATQGAPA